MAKDRIDQAIRPGGPEGMGSEPTYSGVLSFMRRRYTRELDGVDLAITGVPLDTATSNRPGARFGPAAIRAASAMNAWGEPWPWGFDPFLKLEVVDHGDCLWDYGRPDTAPAEIQAHAARILEAGVSMIGLGGDHFLTLPLIRAHAEKHGPLALVHFDAHSDTWADESGRVDHGTMFWHAAREGLVDPGHSIQVGIRTHNEDRQGFQWLDAAWIHAHSSEAAVQAIRQRVGDRPAYLSFDIDCLDPSCAPGTGTPVVGGLSSQQARAILCGLTGIRFVGMDMVEVAPAYDHAEMTALAAATLVLDYICLLAQGRG